MPPAVYRFGNFVVDPGERRLLADGVPVELNARYFDALLLLVDEAGRLVSKDRFMASVWRGIPVTDEALTQCIRTLRRTLGDSATAPRLIETVPKHGYRFIGTVSVGSGEPAPVEPAEPARSVTAATAAPSPRPVEAAAGEAAAIVAPRPAGVPSAARRVAMLGVAGTLGAGLAGLVGGVLFGFAGAAQPAAAGAASVVAVLVVLTVFVALAGGAGVAFGIASSSHDPARPWAWSIAGGAAGGFAVGAVVKLLGLDAFHLLLGQSPGDITGAVEGLVLGGAVGLGLRLGARGRAAGPRRTVICAALTGGVAGAAIPWFGGRLMAGSLDLLARTFPESRLRLDAIGALFGEQGLGVAGQSAAGAIEGALFAACVAGAMAAAHRALAAPDGAAADQAGRSGGASNADA